MIFRLPMRGARRGAPAPQRAPRACRSLLALLLALTLGQASAAGVDCSGQTLCIQVVAGNGVTELRAVNRGAFAITAGLTLTPVNMSLESDPSARVVPPGQTVSLARLRVIDPERPTDYRYRLKWSRGDYRATHDDNYGYGLPYRPGPGFPVSQGYNGEFSHNGDSSYAIDFKMPIGTPVVAAREGTVVAVRDDSREGGAEPRYADAANYVVIAHADGSFAEYLHLRYQGVRVREGERVRRGQLLGESGNTGFSSGPHLHFMVAGATSDAGRRSFPLRIMTAGGVLAELERGRSYRNGAPDGVDEAIAAREAADPTAGESIGGD